MPLTNAGLTALAAATLAAANTTSAKATALVGPLVTLVVKELCDHNILTPSQQNKAAALVADIAANVATFATAITVTGD